MDKCIVCDKDISLSRSRKYCSNSCREQAKRNRDTIYRHNRKVHGKIKECSRCIQPYNVTESRDKRYCDKCLAFLKIEPTKKTCLCKGCYVLMKGNQKRCKPHSLAYRKLQQADISAKLKETKLQNTQKEDIDPKWLTRGKISNNSSISTLD